MDVEVICDLILLFVGKFDKMMYGLLFDFFLLNEFVLEVEFNC